MLIMAQQPELKHTRNNCHGCLTLVSYLLSGVFHVFPALNQCSGLHHPRTPISRQATTKTGSMCCAVNRFTAGMESQVLTRRDREVLSRGPSSEGFSFTSQRFPLSLFQSHHYSKARENAAELLLGSFAGTEELWSMQSLALIKSQ